MTSPRTRGRMLNKGISDSKGFSKLSPEAAVLFCMMIPNYTSHGKMNGDPRYIKSEICPRVHYLTTENIPALLTEISNSTNVKWFMKDERYWIHSTKFLSEHQKLKTDRLGEDKLPSYSGSDPDLILMGSGSTPPEVEVEVEVEVEGKTRPTPDLLRSKNDAKGQDVEKGNGDGREPIPIENLVPSIRPSPKITSAVTRMTDDEYEKWVRFAYNFILDHKKVEEWKKNFPDVNVFHELNKASDWLLDHPHKRKSHAFQFYGNWIRNASTPKERGRTG